MPRTAFGVLAVCVLLAACAPPPRRPPPARPLRVVVISDLNGAYGATRYAPEVALAVELIRDRWKPDLVLAAGDLVAGQDPALSDSIVRAMWSAFDAAVATPLREAGIPLLATVGNHDASAYPAHARDRALAAAYWREPAHAPGLTLLDGAGFPFRFTARLGDLFVAVWDATNEESSRDGALRDWLRSALQSPEARAARHRVVLGHLPLYAVATGRDRDGEVLAGGDALRQEMERWGATLYISGHHHAYYPARRGQLDLLHAGALGEGPRPLLGSAAAPWKSVTVIDLAPGGIREHSYRLDGATGQVTLIPQSSLPPFLCARAGGITRRDLPPTAPPCPR